MDISKINQQKEFLINRIKKNEKMLSKWKKENNIRCYRIYDKDIPEIPLVIEIFENCINASEYRTFKVEDEKSRREWLLELLYSVAQYYNIKNENVFLKMRKRQKGLNQYEKFDNKNHIITVEENGLKFLVNLSDYLDSWLFLDHRITRKMVKDEAKDKKILNLFCYTGSFSIYALSGDAKNVVSVDLSNRYLDVLNQNIKINNLDIKKHKTIREDALRYIDLLIKEKERFDIIIFDPPTFSNSKKMKGYFDIQRDYINVINKLLILLNENGVIYFSTNFKKFKFQKDSINSNKIEDISLKTIPPDFRDKKIHYCYKIYK